MNILLFGASGFLGRHIGASLAQNATVQAPDRQECDLVAVDVPTLVDLLSRVRPDAVVLAAGRTVGAGHDFVQAHSAVTAKLIDAMAETASEARLVRIGSAAEYGVVPHGHAVREDDPAEPVGEYGLSHLVATRLAALAAASGRVDTVVLRVFNPVGPGVPEGNLLGRTARRFREALARGERELPLGLHDTYRDFVDVRDVAQAVLAAIRIESVEARIFNVGSGQAVATTAVVRMLADAAGFTGRITDGAFAPDAARSSAVPWMCADLERSASILGWTPMHTLSESLDGVWAGGNPGQVASAVRSVGHPVTV